MPQPNGIAGSLTDPRFLVQLISLAAMIGLGLVRIETTLAQMDTRILHVSKVVEGVTREMSKIDERVDAHDRLLGRGVPPPEVQIRLDQIESRLKEIEQSIKKMGFSYRNPKPQPEKKSDNA